MEAFSRYNNILFDLDGTLTDPKVGITKSVCYSLSKFGIIENDSDKLTMFIGPPLWESFSKYYDFNKAQANEAVSYYREYFSEKGIFENEIYDGIENLLSELCKNKMNVILATSKPKVYASRILEYFNISKYFAGIEGSELDGRLSNKSELIGHILKEYSIAKSDALMVGDREHDIIGAVNNKIDSVGVGYGYGTEKELKDAGATYYVESVKKLKVLIIGRESA